MATKKKTTAGRSTKKSVAWKAAAKPAVAKSAKAKSAKPKTLSLSSPTPGLTVNDVEKSLAWYRDVLGFTVTERWEEKGKLLGVEMAAGEFSIMLGQDDWKKGRNRVKGEGFRIFCKIDEDVDRLAQRIKANGGKLAQEPADQPWGMRDFSIDDPDGFKFTFGADLKK